MSGKSLLYLQTYESSTVAVSAEVKLCRKALKFRVTCRAWFKQIDNDVAKVLTNISCSIFSVLPTVLIRMNCIAPLSMNESNWRSVMIGMSRKSILRYTLFSSSVLSNTGGPWGRDVYVPFSIEPARVGEISSICMLPLESVADTSTIAVFGDTNGLED